MLKIQNVNLNINNKQILSEINLNIPNNKLIVITGANGSGKSTLAKAIIGLQKIDGKIIYNEKDITSLTPDQRANIGLSFAFQQPVKFKGLTVRDILNVKNNYTEQVLIETLNQVGLESDYLNRQLDNTLSGGEHKRIEIATILLKSSDLTIFDEPEAGIDLWSFNQLIDLFKKINKTTIIISHQEKILRIADEIILMEKGKIKSQGKYEEVIKNG